MGRLASTEPQEAATRPGTFHRPHGHLSRPLGQPGHGRTGGMTVPSSHRSTMVSVLQSYSMACEGHEDLCAFLLNPDTDSQEAWPSGS